MGFFEYVRYRGTLLTFLCHLFSCNSHFERVLLGQDGIYLAAWGLSQLYKERGIQGGRRSQKPDYQ